jgi:hypothetical protein
MFGHGWLPDLVDLGVAGGVVVELDVLGAAALCVPVALVVLVVLGAADALAIPAAAPPVASAPATMVAPSILEMVIGSNLLGSIDGVQPSCRHSLSRRAAVRRGFVSAWWSACLTLMRTYVRALEQPDAR